MTGRRLTAAALVAAAAVVLAAPATASAHATLQAAEPERGAELERPPAQVTLRFDEPVEVQLGAVRVFDASGRQVQRGAATHPGGRQDTIAVGLQPGLGDGGYTVAYRVISADSHPVSGGWVFQVGDGGRAATSVDAALAASASGPVTATAFAATRAIQYGAIAVALGAWLFVTLCWLPAVRGLAAEPAAFAGRIRLLLLLAAGAGLVSALAGLALQAATAEGTSFWAALRPSVIGDVLGTRFGRVWGIAALAWVALAALTVVRRRAMVAVPLVLLALLPALSGHAGVQDPTWLMLPANVVHVGCVSAWVGGIVALVFALRAATRSLDSPDRSRLLAAVVGRFSTVAGVAFALILASGIAQSLVALDRWSQLTSTAYGRAVLIKVGLFAALVGLGALNRRRTVPALQGAAGDGRAPGRTGDRLLAILRTELILGVAVLGVTGALATYPPGKALAAGPYSVSRVIGPARAELVVDPARVGVNELHVYLFDRRTGVQYRAVEEITAAAALPAKGVPEIPIDLRQAGPGHYVSTGARLPIRGTWRLSVTVRVSEFDQHTIRLDVPIEGA